MDFEGFGVMVKGFLWVWVAIIAILPNMFMGGLTACIKAMALSYLVRDFGQDPAGEEAV